MKEGPAAAWANNVVQAMCNPKDLDTLLYRNYEDFKKNLIDAFKGGAQVEITQAKIEKLCQGAGTTSNNSFSVLTIEESSVEEDTMEVESEGANSPSDSKRRGKKPQKPEWEKAKWRRLPLRSTCQVTTQAHTQVQTAYFPDALSILDNLKNLPQYIWVTGNSMMIPMTLEGLNNLKGYMVIGLVNSGATVRATLSLVRGTETSRGIQSINNYTRIQEWKYYAPSGGIQREERMRIPMLGAALKLS
jgi:hypothetical protein